MRGLCFLKNGHAEQSRSISRVVVTQSNGLLQHARCFDKLSMTVLFYFYPAKLLGRTQRRLPDG